MANARDTKKKKPNGNLRRILVASDLTAYSDRAFDRAVMLAVENKAAVHFLHAIERNLLPDGYVRQNIREAQARLEHEVRDSGIGTHLDVSVKVAMGDADKTIVEESRVMQSDLIVMGLSHDATLAGMVRGTTIEKVVRRTRCPVLVVKTRARRSYVKIAAAVDLAEPSRQALDFALRVFPSAKFTILHVDETTRVGRRADAVGSAAGIERRHQIEDMVAARFESAGRGKLGATNGPALIVENGKAVNVLQEQVLRLHPDLVVLGTHGRTGVSDIFLGSVAETLLEVLPHDVLVARA
ncbi:MAG: universal stress family protein 3 [Rhodospirillaceae bacterium]|nr:MAG: universal stress family protein 3 [Rhodospirillaceae bacterium]